MPEFVLPSLGADMETATVVQWMIEPGASFRRGDVIAAVETNKGIIDIEIFADGTLDRILVNPGEKVAVGTVLATYHGTEPSSGEVRDRPESTTADVSQPPSAEPSPRQSETTKVAATQATRRPVSPAARRRARELNIDIDAVAGSGPNGSVVMEDIERAIEAYDNRGMRRTIATAMAKSKREIPHYYLSTAIDMRAALEWLEQYNRMHGVSERMVYAVLLLKAMALALNKTPALNGWWIDDVFRQAGSVDIGVAISLRSGGLVVPVLRDVANTPIAQLMENFSAVVNRARQAHLRQSDLSGATITFTNLGEQGAEVVFPIIHPPQVAIVGFGSIIEKPWASGGELGIRPVLTATLAADHRATDGHLGSRFLSFLKQLLQKPEAL